jgi:hypothetical protein
MNREFDVKKTIKVSGVSQLLRDQFTKALQTKNSTGYKDDVNKLCVCPHGEDHVLVEFVNDISGKFAKQVHITACLQARVNLINFQLGLDLMYDRS